MPSPAAPRPRLILGSASPRRAALMAQLGLPFEQVVSAEPEPVPGSGAADPAAFVVRSAAAKATAVGRQIETGADALIAAADTVVVLDSRIMGKPRDTAGAGAMLRQLSGRTHEVFTGICLQGAAGAQLTAAERTSVTMLRLGPAQIEWYLASGEPLDKAGAYAIQGLGARFIERIDGCYYNVVGLPLARLCAMLERAGYHFEQPQAG